LLDDGVNPLVVLRKTLYELMAQFAGGGTALQFTVMLLDEAAVAVTLAGAAGEAGHDDPPPSGN
jgi:hypothetical protein